jgi:membrane protease subunit (stomatin/prohibitin family)
MGQAMIDALKKSGAAGGETGAASVAGSSTTSGSAAEMKFCLNCGKPIPKVSKFCPECGHAQP